MSESILNPSSKTLIHKKHTDIASVFVQGMECELFIEEGFSVTVKVSGGIMTVYSQKNDQEATDNG